MNLQKKKKYLVKFFQNVSLNASLTHPGSSSQEQSGEQLHSSDQEVDIDFSEDFFFFLKILERIKAAEQIPATIPMTMATVRARLDFFLMWTVGIIKNTSVKNLFYCFYHTV